MSLRLRLLTGLAALVVLGLGVFGTVTYLSVNHFLLNRLDSQLSDAARALTGTDAARLRIPGGGGPGGGPGPDGPEGTGSDETSARNAAGPELFVEFVHPDGSVFEPVKATRDPGGVAPSSPRSLLRWPRILGTGRRRGRSPPPLLKAAVPNAWRCCP